MVSSVHVKFLSPYYKVVKFDVLSWLHTLQYFQQNERNVTWYMLEKSIPYQRIKKSLSRLSYAPESKMNKVLKQNKLTPLSLGVNYKPKVKKKWNGV